jgi:hypothetical protein
VLLVKSLYQARRKRFKFQKSTKAFIELTPSYYIQVLLALLAIYLDIPSASKQGEIKNVVI